MSKRYAKDYKGVITCRKCGKISVTIGGATSHFIRKHERKQKSAVGIKKGSAVLGKVIKEMKQVFRFKHCPHCGGEIPREVTF